jgi:hypothetical protein
MGPAGKEMKWNQSEHKKDTKIDETYRRKDRTSGNTTHNSNQTQKCDAKIQEIEEASK